MSTSPLNTPARIIRGLDSVHRRIDEIDRVLGVELKVEFAEAVAALLLHIEPDAGGLVSTVASRQEQIHLVAGLIQASAEFDTGWNTVRLGNIPAAQRQGRVGTEFVAAGVLQSLPRSAIRQRLPKTDPLATLVRKYPTEAVADLMSPSLSAKGKVVPARLLSMRAFNSFVTFVAGLPGISTDDVEWLQHYRKVVQNAASHGSSELIAYHFEGARVGKPLRGGAFFDPDRAESYRTAGRELNRVVHVLTRFLNAISSFISRTAGG